MKPDQLQILPGTGLPEVGDGHRNISTPLTSFILLKILETLSKPQHEAFHSVYNNEK